MTASALKIGDRFSREELERIGIRFDAQREAKPDKGDLPAEWFIVYSWNVAKAIESFDDIGVHTFYPLMKVRRTVRRTRRYANPTSMVIETPMFPGYLFVAAGTGIDPKNVEGVTVVLRVSDDRYARVPHALIEKLQDLIAQGKFDNAKKLREVFPPGTAVRVCDGPFTGFPAKVEKALGGQQARILVEIFGRITPVVLDLEQFEAA